jgi:hypothetical protein
MKLHRADGQRLLFRRSADKKFKPYYLIAASSAHENIHFLSERKKHVFLSL